MNREIIFRGKRIDNGEWTYGDLFHGEPIRICSNEDGELYPVEPATVGQFTGLLDKNGTQIFEGDIIPSTYSRSLCPDCERDECDLCKNYEETTTTKTIEWRKLFGYDADFFLGFHFPQGKIEVVDNIHDNPELLEER
jgi:uncharacterized phage protein (TIGR01671 family)